MKPDRVTDWNERRFQPLIGGRNDAEDAAFRDREFLFEEIVCEDLMRTAIDSISKEGSLQLREFMERLEKEIILKALWKVEGNLKRAAKLLGVKYTTLHEKLKKHDIRIRRDAY